MIINRIYINIVIRVTLIMLSCLLFGIAYIKFNDVLININFLALIGLQTYLLVSKLNITNHTIANFFNSIEYDDSSIILKDRLKWKSHQRLLAAMDSVNQKIKQLKIKSAGQEAYYESLLENASIGMIVIDKNNRIHLFNPAARRLLNYSDRSNPLHLDKSFPELSTIIKDQQPSEQKLVKVKSGNEQLQLTVSRNPIKVIDQNLNLISIHNIKSVLEEKELETWQKMIRVLTHEIMNSVGPINSTIATINEVLTENNADNIKTSSSIGDESIEDVVSGLRIIDEQSKGLMEFVKKFRSLTLLPNPSFETISASKILNDTELLLRKEISEKKIDISLSVEPKTLKLSADSQLLRQILINLIKNSIDALEDTKMPYIIMKAYRDNENIVFAITDNGKGISPNDIDNVFIPFFTTKEKGSGIGLSLARQVMRMHGGSISVESEAGNKTIFTLIFRQKGFHL